MRSEKRYINAFRGAGRIKRFIVCLLLRVCQLIDNSKDNERVPKCVDN